MATEDVNTYKRPFILVLACYTGFIYYGLISLIFLISIIAVLIKNELIKIYSEQYGILMEGFLHSSFVVFVLYVISFISVIYIWKRNEKFLYVLAMVSILIFLFQLLSDSLNWINLLIASLIFFSGLYSKKHADLVKINSESENENVKFQQK